MRVIILAGGRGTRLSEETTVRPKPMVEIGGRPMLWHLMKLYASYGYDDFLIACGYKGELIKEYFANFFVHNSDFFVNQNDGTREIVGHSGANWRVGVIDTGMDTMTGGRIRRLRQWVGDEPFMVTYGDGLGDIDLKKLEHFHRAHGKIATVTAVHPPSRYGALTLEDDMVLQFSEKPQTAEGWINGGFFVFEPAVFDYLTDDTTILEREPMERLAGERQIMAYRHTGFWQPMDTIREKQTLESLWAKGNPPWKRWK